MDFRRIFFLLCLIWPLMSFLAFADTAMVDSSTSNTNSQVLQDSTGGVSTEKSSQESEESKAGIQNLWKLVSLAGNIGICIGIIFFVGIFFICLEFINRVTDRKKSMKILGLSFEKLKLEQIEKVVNDQTKSNLISILLSKLLEIYKETASSDRFNEEILKYKQVLQERFDTFKTRLAFFSDTCGALGLIGTVWGMYRTFHGGLLDPQLILTGMGIALITTLLGLVASIILNLLTTEIISSFNKTLDVVTEKSYKFQLRIIEEEKLNAPKDRGYPVYVPLSERESIVTEPKSIEEEQPTERVLAKKVDIIKPHKIFPVSGDNLTGVVMTKLREPLVARVSDEIDNSLAYKKVKFKIEKGSGRLSNGEDTYEVKTDENGEAKTELTLGDKVGEIIIIAEVIGKGNRVLYCRFKTRAKAGEPATLRYISGNYQTGNIGSTVKKPLVIQITDSFGNPIKDYKVVFKVESGEGRFPGGKDSIFEGATDPDGILALPFILGEKPGSNRISVNTKGLAQSDLEFELFGQPRSES